MIISSPYRSQTKGPQISLSYWDAKSEFFQKNLSKVLERTGFCPHFVWSSINHSMLLCCLPSYYRSWCHFGSFPIIVTFLSCLDPMFPLCLSRKQTTSLWFMAPLHQPTVHKTDREDFKSLKNTVWLPSCQCFWKTLQCSHLPLSPKKLRLTCFVLCHYFSLSLNSEPIIVISTSTAPFVYYNCLDGGARHCSPFLFFLFFFWSSHWARQETGDIDLAAWVSRTGHVSHPLEIFQPP
jgi:hypothetical protein